MSFFKKVFGAKDSPNKTESKEYEPPVISVPNAPTNTPKTPVGAPETQQPAHKPVDLSAFGVANNATPESQKSPFSSSASLFGGMQIKTVPKVLETSSSPASSWGGSLDGISPKRPNDAFATNRAKRSNSVASDNSSISSSHSGNPAQQQSVIPKTRAGASGRRRGGAKVGATVKQKRRKPDAALDSPASLNRSNEDAESMTSDTASTTSSKKLSVIDLDNQLDFGGLTIKTRQKDDALTPVDDAPPKALGASSSLNELMEAPDVETPPPKKQPPKEVSPPAATKQSSPSASPSTSSSILKHFANQEPQDEEPVLSLHEQLQKKWQDLKSTMRDTFQSLYLESSSLQNEKRELFAKRASTLAAIEALKSQVETNEADLMAVTQNEDYDAAEQLTQKIDSLQKDIITQQDRLVTVERLLQHTEEKRNQLPQLIIEQYNTFVEKVRQQEEEQLREYKEFSRDAEIKKTYTEGRLSSEKLRLQRMRENVETDLAEVGVRKQKLQERIDEQTVDIRTEMVKEEDVSNALQLEISDLRRRLQKKEAELEKVQEKINAARRTIEKHKRKFKRELEEIAKQEKHASEREIQFQQQQREYKQETSSMESTLQEIHQQEEMRRRSLDDMKCFVEKSNIFTKMIGRQREHLDRIRKEREAFDTENTTTTKKVADIERRLATHQDRVKASLLTVETHENKIERLKKQLQKVEAKIPLLEAEKQQAAEKRQFREAGRLHKEIKALEEKEEELEKEQDDTQNLLRAARAANDDLIDEEKTLQDSLKELKSEYENGFFKQVLREKIQLQVMVDEYQKVSSTTNADDEANVMDISSQYNVGLQLLEIELDTVTNEHDILVNSLKLSQDDVVDIEEDMRDELQPVLEKLRADFSSAGAVTEESTQPVATPSPVREAVTEVEEESDSDVEIEETPADATPAPVEEVTPAGEDDFAHLTASEVDDRLNQIAEEITSLEQEIEVSVQEEEYEKCDDLQSRVDALIAEREKLEQRMSTLTQVDDDEPIKEDSKKSLSEPSIDEPEPTETEDSTETEVPVPSVDISKFAAVVSETMEEETLDVAPEEDEPLPVGGVDLSKFGQSEESTEEEQIDDVPPSTIDFSKFSTAPAEDEAHEEEEEDEADEDTPAPTIDLSKFAAPAEEEVAEDDVEVPAAIAGGIDLSKFGAVTEDAPEEAIEEENLLQSNVDFSKFGVSAAEDVDDAGIDLSKFGAAPDEEDLPLAGGIDLSKFGASTSQEDEEEETQGAPSSLGLLSKFNVKNAVQRTDSTDHLLPVDGVSGEAKLGGWGDSDDDN